MSATESTEDITEESIESEPLPDLFDTYESQRVPDENSRTQDFVEITSPSPASDPDYPSPILKEISGALKQQRLLVIAGELVDKRSVARSAAWEFAQACIDLEDMDVIAVEFRQTADSQSLLLALDNTETPTVFVYPDTEPHRFGGNLQRLYRNTRQKHWVILTTERPKDAWLLQSETASCWIQPERTKLYKPGSLEKYLYKRLSKADIASPHPLRWQNGGEVNMRDLSAKLATPESIDAFVAEYLHASSSKSNVKLNIEKLIDLAISPPEAIYHWFSNQLNEREKTVAIALSLLVGLDEDVAFDVIEHLMEGVWRRRDTSFRFIDYGDLTHLSSYIFFEKQGSGSARIVLRGADTRYHILSAAWPTHRRQIVAALAALVALAKASIGKSDASIAAFRHKHVKKQIQRLTGESLGDASRLSLEAVEPLLLTLVADGRFNAHSILADALGQLRSAKDPQNILKMLSRWRANPEIQRYLAGVMNQSEPTKIEQTIGSAITISIGRLALYDSPNAIDTDIIRLLKSYCRSDQTSIIYALAYQAIPPLIPVHWLQMKTLLPELFDRIGNDPLQCQMLVAGIGFGLGQGLLAGRVELLDLVKEWIDNGSKNTTTNLDETTISEREKEMAASVYALALSRTDQTNKTDSTLSSAAKSGYFSPAAAGQIIATVLNKERHPFVRKAANAALEHLLTFEFEAAVPSLENSLNNLSPEERNSLISSLVDFHRKQRSRQRGGDTTIRIGKYDFPIWYDKTAPETEILKQVFKWSTNPSNQRIAAFAGEILVEIRRQVERTEEQELKNIKERREKERLENEELEKTAVVRPLGHDLKLSFVQRFIIVPISVPFRQQHLREPVAGHLAAYMDLVPTEQADVIERFRTACQQELANSLSTALWLDKHKAKSVWIPILLIALYLYLSN